MKKFAALIGAAALGLGLQSAAHAYTANATVTFTFGGSTNSATGDQSFGSLGGFVGFDCTPQPCAGIQPDNSTLIHTLVGANATSTYNSDFVPDAAACAAGGGIVPASAGVSAARKYGCRWGSSTNNMFTPNAVTDGGPLAQASGTITVHDTTLTGTLTIVNTSDEPTGATTTFFTATTGVPGTTRISNSFGNGFAGYNYRTAGGSPFGVVWYGVTNAGTYTLNLTGTFNSTTWTITGGYATFADPGLACQQGGLGGDSGRGTLCSSSTTGGGFDPGGGHLSWGMDPDGSATGTSLIAAPIQLRDIPGTTTLATLSGVIANLGISAGGAITTSSGETRRGLGSAGAGCSNHIRYNQATNMLTCGLIEAGNLVITGQVNDSDSDGVLDGIDNCTLVANNTGAAAQCDSDADGYGNRCDGDMNNNNLTNTQDYGLWRQRLGLPSVAPVFDKGDINCNTLVNTQDYGFFRGLLGPGPGPSGLH